MEEGVFVVSLKNNSEKKVIIITYTKRPWTNT